MKTLINKANPMIRITVPEVEKIYDKYYYIKDLRLGLLQENWTLAEDMRLGLLQEKWILIEEGSPKIISDKEMKQMGEEISKAAVDNINEQFSKIAEEEQKPEVKFTGWVARDRNGELWVYGAYPEKDSIRQLWVGSNSMILDPESFPNLKWEDGPVEVEITITRKPS